MKPIRWWLAAGLALLGCAPTRAATLAEAAQARLDADARAGRPLVAHVVVALCDNQHQSIVRVPKALGNGQDPRTNLYWGARYGLKTYLRRDGGWQAVAHKSDAPDGVLERLVLTRRVARRGQAATAWVVADAWDGRRIRDAIDAFLRMAGGHAIETVRVEVGGRAVALRAGGAAHLVAYVGHNGLMDFALPRQPAPSATSPPRSAVVLACKSQPHFGPPLRRAGAHALLLTTGFMAPEAYTLDAALKSWLAGGAPEAVGEAAAQAYHRYQRCGLRGARRLFATGP